MSRTKRRTASPRATPPLRGSGDLSAEHRLLAIIAETSDRGEIQTITAEEGHRRFQILVDRRGPFSAVGAGLSGAAALEAAAELASGSWRVESGWPQVQATYHAGLPAVLARLRGLAVAPAELPPSRGVDAAVQPPAAAPVSPAPGLDPFPTRTVAPPMLAMAPPTAAPPAALPAPAPSAPAPAPAGLQISASAAIDPFPTPAISTPLPAMVPPTPTRAPAEAPPAVTPSPTRTIAPPVLAMAPAAAPAPAEAPPAGSPIQPIAPPLPDWAAPAAGQASAVPPFPTLTPASPVLLMALPEPPPPQPEPLPPAGALPPETTAPPLAAAEATPAPVPGGRLASEDELLASLRAAAAPPAAHPLEPGPPRTSARQGPYRHALTQALLWALDVDQPGRYTLAQAWTLARRGTRMWFDEHLRRVGDGVRHPVGRALGRVGEDWRRSGAAAERIRRQAALDAASRRQGDRSG